MAGAGERELLDAALAGDAEGVRRLVERLTPVIQRAVANVVLRLRPRGSDADRQEVRDITQEVLLSLFAQEARLLRAWDPKRGASLSTFVALVAQRRAISLLRGALHRRVLSDDLSEVGDAAEAAQPEARAESRQELERLLARVQSTLSPLGLELFYRLLVHGEPVDDVCKALNLSQNAVYVWRSRLSRHVRKLRDELHAEPAAHDAEPALAQSDELETAP